MLLFASVIKTLLGEDLFPTFSSLSTWQVRLSLSGAQSRLNNQKDHVKKAAGELVDNTKWLKVAIATIFACIE